MLGGPLLPSNESCLDNGEDSRDASDADVVL
jgi:hypothetical protein